MNFNRQDELFYSDYKEWLDYRMMAFKHHLMDNRLLYFDMVNSREILVNYRQKIQNLLLEYLNILPRLHPESITSFNITEDYKNLRNLLAQNYYMVLGDSAIIGITPHAQIADIIEGLNTQIFNNISVRYAVGYYTGCNDFWSVTDEYYMLESHYFKGQMILGKINDTKPTSNQIEDYYSRNTKYIKKMEMIHHNNLFK